MKKFIAVILAAVFCIFAASCSKSDAPDGMQNATVAGEPFRLYVPEDWQVNTDSGISSAYYSPSDKVVVTARYYLPSEPEMTVDAYLDLCSDGYALSMTDFSITERSAAILSGSNAVKLVYSVTSGGVKYTCTQTTALYNGFMISLNTIVPSEKSDTYSEAFKSITENFVITGFDTQTYEAVTDKKTPAGMKIASSDDLEYRLYVPENWVCNPESRKAEAYYPESGKTNVTVTSFSPDSSSQTLEEYYKLCIESYEKSIRGFEIIGETDDITVASKAAKSVEFRAEYDGVEYRIRQVILLRNEMFYTITYTAISDNYELHTGDFEQIISAFRFR